MFEKSEKKWIVTFVYLAFLCVTPLANAQDRSPLPYNYPGEFSCMSWSGCGTKNCRDVKNLCGYDVRVKADMRIDGVFAALGCPDKTFTVPDGRIRRFGESYSSNCKLYRFIFSWRWWQVSLNAPSAPHLGPIEALSWTYLANSFRRPMGFGVRRTLHATVASAPVAMRADNGAGR